MSCRQTILNHIHTKCEQNGNTCTVGNGAHQAPSSSERMKMLFSSQFEQLNRPLASYFAHHHHIPSITFAISHSSRLQHLINYALNKINEINPKWTHLILFLPFIAKFLRLNTMELNESNFTVWLFTTKRNRAAISLRLELTWKCHCSIEAFQSAHHIHCSTQFKSGRRQSLDIWIYSLIIMAPQQHGTAFFFHRQFNRIEILIQLYIKKRVLMSLLWWYSSLTLNLTLTLSLRHFISYFNRSLARAFNLGFNRKSC